jgi:hypothetical protein
VAAGSGKAREADILFSMAVFFAALGGFAFGAAVQYLGTLAAGSVLGTWSWTVSGLSAPWLVLPFVVGLTQERSRRAMALGLIVSLAALSGYFAMTQSPMEGTPISRFFPQLVTMVRTGYNPLWIVGGLVTGPLYGLLGQRWRVRRSWISAALVACALCFEPLARGLVGTLSPHPMVWVVEVALGGVMAVSFAFLIVVSRRTATGSALPPSTRSA